MLDPLSGGVNELMGTLREYLEKELPGAPGSLFEPGSWGAPMLAPTSPPVSGTATIGKRKSAIYLNQGVLRLVLFVSKAILSS